MKSIYSYKNILKFSAFNHSIAASMEMKKNTDSLNKHFIEMFKIKECFVRLDRNPISKIDVRRPADSKGGKMFSFGLKQDNVNTFTISIKHVHEQVSAKLNQPKPKIDEPVQIGELVRDANKPGIFVHMCCSISLRLKAILCVYKFEYI